MESNVSKILTRESSNTEKIQQGSNTLLLSIVAITKNAPPKVFKVLLNIPDGCSYERYEG